MLLERALETLHVAIAAFVAGPLLYAAAAKLLEPSGFVAAIPRFNLSLLAASPSAARSVALVELVGGAAVVVFSAGWSAVVTGSVYVLFSFVLLRARLLGSSGDCGCFGALSGGIDRRGIARNLAFAVASFGIGYWRLVGVVPPYDARTGGVAVVLIALASAVLDTALTLRKRAA